VPALAEVTDDCLAFWYELVHVYQMLSAALKGHVPQLIDAMPAMNIRDFDDNWHSSFWVLPSTYLQR
jgi:hypothetical protein